MNNVAKMDARERADLFGETAERKEVAEAIVEKGFWVCWVLKQLFSIDAFNGRLLFKGGTSLSKIFHAINRFSEDIDLAVDYAALGFTGDRDPRQEKISKTKRADILKEMMAECQRYIGSEFLEVFRARCQKILGTNDTGGLGVRGQDPNVVEFRYPVSSTKSLSYVAPQVVLELGTHAEFIRMVVSPFAHLLVRNFQMWLRIGMFRLSHCLRSGLSGKKQPSFTRNITVPWTNPCRIDIRVITMTLP